MPRGRPHVGDWGLREPVWGDQCTFEVGPSAPLLGISAAPESRQVSRPHRKRWAEGVVGSKPGKPLRLCSLLNCAQDRRGLLLIVLVPSYGHSKTPTPRGPWPSLLLVGAADRGPCGAHSAVAAPLPQRREGGAGPQGWKGPGWGSSPQSPWDFLGGLRVWGGGWGAQHPAPQWEGGVLRPCPCPPGSPMDSRETRHSSHSH